MNEKMAMNHAMTTQTTHALTPLFVLAKRIAMPFLRISLATSYSAGGKPTLAE